MIDYDNKATKDDIKLAESISRQFIGMIDTQPVQIPHPQSINGLV